MFIRDSIGRDTMYSYNGYYLSSVEYPDGATVQYSYLGDMISSVYDAEANYGVRYTIGSIIPSEHNGNSVGEYREIDEYYIGQAGRTYGRHILIENPTYLQTRYHDVGCDGIFGNADDVITTYVFDSMGRTAGVYASDKDYQKIYGSSSTVYTSPGVTPKKRNRVTSTGVIGTPAENLLADGSVETSWTWNGYGNAARTASKKRTGYYSLFLSSSSLSSEHRFEQASPTLSYGHTYTVSAYVNVANLSNISSTGGVYLKAAHGGDIHSGKELNINFASDDKWQRISLTFVADYSGSYAISICLSGAIGSVYIDDIQLEESSAPSSFNLIDAGGTWYKSAFCFEETYEDSYVQRPALHFIGAQGRTVYAERTITVNKSAENTYMLSAWASGYSLPLSEDRDYSINARINYTDGTSEDYSFPFLSEASGIKQFVSGTVMASEANKSKTIASITLEIQYNNNVSSGAYVFDVALIEGAGCSYSYDNNGNMATAAQTALSAVNSSYNNANNLTQMTQGGQQYNYSYKTTGNTHLVDTVENDGITMSFTYDEAGNVTGTVITKINSGIRLESSSYTYDGNNNYFSENYNGIATEYEYNSRNLLVSANTEGRIPTEYDYDENNDRPAITYISGLVSVNYNYTRGMLAEIVRGGYISGNSVKQNQTYSFQYDGFGNTTKVFVGGTQLVQYTYGPKNGNLLTTTYGNGTVIENTYDLLGRIIQVKINGLVKYNYSYDSQGNLFETEDVDNNAFTWYTYDEQGRLISSRVQKNNTINALTFYTYDDQDRVSKYQCGLAGVTGGSLGHTYQYSYNASNGSLSSLSVKREGAGTDLFTFNYDAIGRLSGKQLSRTNLALATEYGYNRFLFDDRTTMQATDLMWKRQGIVDRTYQYEYDGVGNITGIIRNGSYEAEYTYDLQHQLLTEKRYLDNVLCSYQYDTYGNIRQVAEYNLTTGILLGVKQYGYTDANWLDKLTSYNGVSITYDAIGNPLSYYNGSAYSFTWDNGRELASVYQNGNMSSYSYGVDGLRTEKTVGNTTYEYYYADGRLIRQAWGNNYIDFLYDETGGVYSIVYNGTQYYFMKNLQGDVLQIRNASGAVVTEYTYDAWGKVLSVTGSMSSTIGEYNPIRYRGYYYDAETGFYSLQSRYYDPEIGRFINADNQISTGNDLNGTNLFAYCGNNPIMRVDPTGHAWWHWALGAVVVAACAVATVVTAGGFAAGMAAVAAVGSGMAAATAASTVAAAAFIGSATYLGVSALNAASTSSSVKEFYDQGNWGTVAGTVISAGVAGGSAYASTRSPAPNQTPSNKPISQNTNPIGYPGNDPSKCDIPGFDWRGSGSPDSGKGNFVNMGTGEWLHPDLNHGPPIGSHWDYGMRGNPQTFRIFPDGSMLPK